MVQDFLHSNMIIGPLSESHNEVKGPLEFIKMRYVKKQ